MRIGLTPCCHDRLKLFFCQAHIQSTHRFQCTYRATVTAGERCDLAFLPQLTVDTIVDNGDNGTTSYPDADQIGHFKFAAGVANDETTLMAYNQATLKYKYLMVYVED